ncbi:hypothetical protein E6C60_3080 [Paenibacillus algicola]|uniref:Uncharacterized protein n=1 Tax=Paenibacillus algicola TaxID=2565926 RepID=A0A4P8XQ18_9BACL|nr:hypothetical protein E6C60_3080 [Paenibacillus algicola]
MPYLVTYLWAEPGHVSDLYPFSFILLVSFSLDLSILTVKTLFMR